VDYTPDEIATWGEVFKRVVELLPGNISQYFFVKYHLNLIFINPLKLVIPDYSILIEFLSILSADTREYLGTLIEKMLNKICKEPPSLLLYNAVELGFNLEVPIIEKLYKICFAWI